MQTLTLRTTAAVLALTILTSACSSGAESPAGTAESGADRSAGITNPTAEGMAAYERVCAGCHESGRGGAPRTNQPDDWADRSSLWQAVLTEHARAGYIDMPPRGGDESLSDPELRHATEYMLSIVYPDRALPDD